jgi:hypothetical protein
MTKQIEKTLNLPRLEDAIREFSETTPEIDVTNKKIDEITESITKMPAPILQNPADDGTHAHAIEMDHVYRQALKAYKDMLDLGYNVESRHAGNIFEPAARFLELAMNASKSKSEQKLRTLKLRMDRERLDFIMRGGVVIAEATIDPTDNNSFVADRNDLLKDLVGKLRDSRVPKK